MPGGRRTGSYLEKGSPPSLITSSAVAAGGGPFTGGPFTAGSILFAGGGFVITENNPNLFWDAGLLRVGVRNNTPNYDIELRHAGQNVILGVTNTGVDPTGVAWVRIETQAGAGDPQLGFVVNGGLSWSIFNDNSDSDRLKVWDVAARLTFTQTGSVLVGPPAALATTATDGFLYITSSVGIPTGVPTAETGRLPITIDSAGNTFYFFSSGAWRAASGGAGVVPAAGIVYSDGVSLLSDGTRFWYDAPNDRVGIGNNAPAVDLDVSRSSPGAVVGLLVGNTDNTSVNSHARATLSVGGASAGDPFIQFDVAGVQTWSLGPDNSQTDRFTLSASSALGTSDLIRIISSGFMSFGGTLAIDNSPSLMFTTAANFHARSSTGPQFSTFQALEIDALARSEVATVAAPGGGDAYFQTALLAGQAYTFGIDNSVAGDPWKLSVGFVLGTTDAVTVDAVRNFVLGDAALATTATDGFIHYPSCAGAPTGVPTAYVGRVPTVIDTTGLALYGRIGGAWVNLSGSGAVPSSRTITTTTPLRIDGGASADLSANRTLSVLQFTGVLAGVVPASGGGTTNFLRADATWAAPPGGAAVPANAGVVFTDAVTLLTDIGALTWDAANNRLRVGDNTGTPAADLHVLKTAAGTTVYEHVQNLSTSSDSAAAVIVQTATTSGAADPYLRVVQGAVNFAFGIDVSDATRCKITNSGTPSGGQGKMHLENGSTGGIVIGPNLAAGKDANGYACLVTKDINGDSTFGVENSSNAGSGAHSTIRISSGGSSAGDAKVIWGVNGIGSAAWSAGCDNTDGDSFAIASGPDLGTNVIRATSIRDVQIGAGTLGTGATSGFIMIPTCAGTPTGAGLALGGFAALVWDSANNILYANDGGGWVAV